MALMVKSRRERSSKIVRGERHAVRPPPIAVPGLRPECRHLEGRALEENGHRPVLDARGDHAAKQGRDLFRERIRGDVVIRVGPSHERVAHGAADEVALEAGLPKRRGEISDHSGDCASRLK